MSNKSDELAAQGKFLIFVDGELEKKRERERKKKASEASRENETKGREKKEGKTTNAYITRF